LETDESNKHCQQYAFAGFPIQVLEHLLVFPASNITAGSGTRISHTGNCFIRKITRVPTILTFYFGESSSCIHDSKWLRMALTRWLGVTYCVMQLSAVLTAD
jgi:hypothetical protein